MATNPVPELRVPLEEAALDAVGTGIDPSRLGLAAA
jgi:hypothetical protein